MEPIHLERYGAEQVFRFDERKGNDGMRFHKAVKKIVVSRLTYAQLTGKVMAAGGTHKQWRIAAGLVRGASADTQR